MSVSFFAGSLLLRSAWFQAAGGKLIARVYAASGTHSQTST